ncbi:MAG: hypothetical protein M9949_13705 [Candidatus Kapabacteria bacterium]|nr:hypothetical protein [Candidatus Kapabacteria bacterium]
MFQKLLIIGIFAIFIASCEEGIVSECPTNLDDVKFVATFSSIQTELLTKNCALSGCHAGSIPAGGLVLTSEVAYNNIVNKIAFGETMYIEPGDPDNSYLYQRVNTNTSSVMPPTGKLPQYMIDTLRVWIENGALNN